MNGHKSVIRNSNTEKAVSDQFTSQDSVMVLKLANGVKKKLRSLEKKTTRTGYVTQMSSTTFLRT